MKLANLTLETGENAILFKEEIDVILAVVEKVIKHDGGRIPRSGTFLLYGVKDGEKTAHEIIAGDFGRGPKRNFLGRYQDSRTMAQNVLCQDARNDHEILGDKKESLESRKAKMSAISYFVDSPLFLKLETTNGRFTSAYFVDAGYYSDEVRIYFAVARTLANLGKEDEVLQKSWDRLVEREDDKKKGEEDKEDDYNEAKEIQGLVDSLFEEAKIPAIKDWKEWHEPANDAGNLPLFFG